MKTPREIVEKIVNSVAFHKARATYWNTAQIAAIDKRTEDLRGLRVFTDVEIADTTVAGHRFVLSELEDIHATIEHWRVTRDWQFKEPERQKIVNYIARERALLDLAEIVEG